MTRNLVLTPYALDANAVWSEMYASSQGILYTYDGPNAGGDPAVRDGWACWKIATTSDYARALFGGAPAEIYLHFPFYNKATSGTTDFFRVYNNNTWANYLGLRHMAGGALAAYRGATLLASGGSLNVNQWYDIELWYKPKSTNGRVQIKVDGTSIVDYTGDTTDVADDLLYGLQIQPNNSSPNFVAFGCITVNDIGGAVNNSWPGMLRHIPCELISDEAIAWDRGGMDLGADYRQLRHPGNFAVIQTTVVDEVERYGIDVPDIPAGATITNVIACAVAKVDAGAGNLAVGVRGTASTDSYSSDQALQSGYKLLTHVKEVDPGDSAAWTEADLSSVRLLLKSR